MDDRVLQFVENLLEKTEWGLKTLRFNPRSVHTMSFTFQELTLMKVLCEAAVRQINEGTWEIPGGPDNGRKRSEYNPYEAHEGTYTYNSTKGERQQKQSDDIWREWQKVYEQFQQKFRDSHEDPFSQAFGFNPFGDEQPKEKPNYKRKGKERPEEEPKQGKAAPKGRSERSWWEVLGIDQDTESRRTVMRAYRRLAAKHHPDRGGDLETMKEINRAKDEALVVVQLP